VGVKHLNVMAIFDITFHFKIITLNDLPWLLVIFLRIYMKLEVVKEKIIDLIWVCTGTPLRRCKITMYLPNLKLNTHLTQPLVVFVFNLKGPKEDARSALKSKGSHIWI
jgi:hypothetical protein